jgi:ADP-ribose pyrophosphatase YjhB (NUDIX family)
LHPSAWRRVQETVPILCVDVVPVSTGAGATHVGLIRRPTPHQGVRWCLIGGRVLRDEPLATAVRRHLLDTLGADIRVALPRPCEPVLTTEYFTMPARQTLHDPRKHAIGLVYVATISGRVRAGGEAHEYRWFPIADLPAASAFGFGQGKVLRALLRRMAAAPGKNGRRGSVRVAVPPLVL